MIRKILCPDQRSHTIHQKILIAYEEVKNPSGMFYAYCSVCKQWFKILFNNSSPIIEKLPKNYTLKFYKTPSLVKE